MRHTLTRLASTAAIAALGLAGSGALATNMQARQRGDGVLDQEPDEVETVQPCCASRDDRDFRYPPGLVETPRPHEPFDDATWQRLKEEARRDTTMPRGRDLRDVEPGAGALLRAPGLVSSFEGLQQGEVGPWSETSPRRGVLERRDESVLDAVSALVPERSWQRGVRSSGFVPQSVGRCLQ